MPFSPRYRQIILLALCYMRAAQSGFIPVADTAADIHGLGGGANLASRMAMDSTTPTSNGLASLGGIHPNRNEQGLCENAATPKQHLAKADPDRNGTPKEDSARGEIPNGKVSKDDVSEQNGANQNGLGKEKKKEEKKKEKEKKEKENKEAEPTETLRVDPVLSFFEQFKTI
ncbi:hypothetical protein PGT21_026422 [Puccinia graminis f. sp. tritici]|uniref:Uncharacterized protein n=1 Tax=Puccinia graminis f. sp. tritici TaxID=56615 RepID=A0A5B0MCX4_PUCGR|nr:hypothetical protein PGT21_026422 [Puccinia graminis f. sp. tritici]